MERELLFSPRWNLGNWDAPPRVSGACVVGNVKGNRTGAPFAFGPKKHLSYLDNRLTMIGRQ